MKQKLLRKRYATLISLPNGNHGYLRTLNTFLTWIKTEKTPSRRAFIEWLVGNENVSEGSAANYWQILGRLGFIERLLPLQLTEFGDNFLSAPEQEQAEILFLKLYLEFKGVAEIVDLYLKNAGRSLHLKEVIEGITKQHREWISTKPYEDCIHWLASLGFIEEVSPRSYALSKFGRQLADKFIQSGILDLSKGVKHPYGHYLIQELARAARNGGQPYRFEETLDKALSFIGYSSKLLGGSGDTDVIAESKIVDHQYRVVFDTKARKTGVLTALNLDAILEHKTKHSAHYAVIIAENFSTGNLIKYAEERGIILMKVEVLCQWIAMHCEMPLNLVLYREFFEVSGLLAQIPDAIQAAHQQQSSWTNIISEIIEMAEGNAKKNLSIGKSLDSLHTALMLHLERPLEKASLQETIQLFTHPALSWAIAHPDGGMSLAINRSNIVMRLRRIADLIEELR